ncbi:MAG: hypothetical protein JW760_05670 [Spirochaetales bacterium]|nr:hypothetical protein [Spirochaetales bacterium]
MTIQEFIQASAQQFQPKTPQAALLAAKEGILPAQAYIYKASSVKPLFEEPFDLEELQRILSRQDNDLETDILLMKVLGKLSHHQDAETALFAAESMNAIESRYNRRIEEAAKAVEETPTAAAHRHCAEALYDLALLSSQTAIRKFYLKEAFIMARKLEDLKEYTKEDGLFLVSILNALDMHAQSKQVLAALKERFGKDDSDILEAEAAVAFARRDFMGVILIYLRLGKKKKYLDSRELAALAYWTEQR